MGGDENMEEVEKNERKTEETEKKREEIDSVVAILTRGVYNKSAVYQMELAINELRETQNKPKSFEYQKAINDLMQLLQILQRNTDIIIKEANNLCNRGNVNYEELYDRIAHYIIVDNRLPVEQFFQSCIDIAGTPNILSRPLVGSLKLPMNSDDIFVSTKTRRIFKADEGSESGKILIRAIISTLKRKHKKNKNNKNSEK